MQISAIADGDGPVPGEKEHLVSLCQKQNDSRFSERGKGGGGGFTWSHIYC